MRDGVPLEVGARKHRALLALLLLRANRVASADELIEELWAGRPPPGAAKTLRSYVCRLRATIGDEVVRSRPRATCSRSSPIRSMPIGSNALSTQGGRLAAEDAGWVSGHSTIAVTLDRLVKAEQSLPRRGEGPARSSRARGGPDA